MENLDHQLARLAKAIEASTEQRIAEARTYRLATKEDLDRMEHRIIGALNHSGGLSPEDAALLDKLTLDSAAITLRLERVAAAMKALDAAT